MGQLEKQASKGIFLKTQIFLLGNPAAVIQDFHLSACACDKEIRGGKSVFQIEFPAGNSLAAVVSSVIQ